MTGGRSDPALLAERFGRLDDLTFEWWATPAPLPTPDHVQEEHRRDLNLGLTRDRELAQLAQNERHPH